MGNVHCGGAGEDDEEAFDFLKSKVLEEMDWTTWSSSDPRKASDDFIHIHRPDRAEKNILEPREVQKAILMQAEELVRRDLIEQADGENSHSSILDSSDSVSGLFSDVTTGGFSSYAPSEFARSVGTTDTAKTQQAGNSDRYSRKSKAKRRNRPPIMKSKDKGFTLMKNINEELKNAVSTSEKLRGSGNADDGCSAILPVPLPCLNQDGSSDDFVYSEEVREHMNVLHLKMAPQCTEYCKSHLARVVPDNPIAQAVLHGTSSTNLSPPRDKRLGAAPDLSLASSDSSVSSIDIDFGEGPPSSPVRLLVTDSVFMDLAVTGSLGLVDRKKSGRREPVTQRKVLKSPEHYIVLLNRRSGIPLAVCALKAASKGPPVVRIYATKRRAFGQRPAASTKALGLDWTDSFPLYTWAEIVSEGCYPEQVRYSIFMASGSDGRFEENPSYRALQGAAGSPEIRMVGRTEREDSYSGCAVLSFDRDEDSEEDDDIFYRLSLSKGIDPALLICFAAFVDEAMEKTMRLQCQASL